VERLEVRISAGENLDKIKLPLPAYLRAYYLPTYGGGRPNLKDRLNDATLTLSGRLTALEELLRSLGTYKEVTHCCEMCGVLKGTQILVKLKQECYSTGVLGVLGALN
jgi:hypothetical protein